MNPIPFMKWRWVAIALSGLAIVTAVASLSLQQLNWGLDFTGGTLIEVAYSDSADLSSIRSVLAEEGYEGAVVVSFGTDRDVLVRLPDGYSDEQGALIVDKLRAATDLDIELLHRVCWATGWRGAPRRRGHRHADCSGTGDALRRLSFPD